MNHESEKSSFYLIYNNRFASSIRIYGYWATQNKHRYLPNQIFQRT